MEPASPPPSLSNDDRNMAMLCHLLNILPLLGPLLIWLVRKDASAVVDREGKEALNFGISVVLAIIVAKILAVVTLGLGFFLAPVAYLAGLLFAVLAGLEASKTGTYRYPYTLRLLK